MLRGVSSFGRNALLKSLMKPKKLNTVFSRAAGSFEKFPPAKGLYNKLLEKDSCGVGLVAHMKKVASRQIVLDANEMLVRMSHRGGTGSEVHAGDGAGILVGMPDAYYRRVFKEETGVTLGPMNSYGAGIVFMSKNDAAFGAIKDIFDTQAQQRGLKVLGWRTIKTG
jgi:glutamate synthase (NADH)